MLNGWNLSRRPSFIVQIGLSALFGLLLSDASSAQSRLSTDQIVWQLSSDESYTADIAVSNAKPQPDTTALRTFTLSSDFPLRDQTPANGQRIVVEQAQSSRLYSDSPLFDGLYALATEELRQNSVSQISDWSFETTQCSCFETGELWKYVWTRDISYSVDLGLGQLDLDRALQSLLFKLSSFRSEHGGSNSQFIVQDTGSGGSYPVSSDRVVWALGMEEVLKHMAPADQEKWRRRVLDVLKNVIYQDRGWIFDTRDGLYRGEQSFLDWRQQSYPSWTAQDVTAIYEMKALSTNVLHFAMLRFAAQLAAGAGESTESDKFSEWARALKTSINAAFWQENPGRYLALVGPELDRGPIDRLDQLGTALAIIMEVADPEQGRRAISNYPATTAGVPVMWPQQPFTPIYHNRAIWPFASAYWALAAKKVLHQEAFDHTAASLMRGAALNLSNMENFEFLTQKNWLDDGAYSGPVVNSRRQLWSVAGYLALVIKGIVGIELDESGSYLTIQPTLTPWLRENVLQDGFLRLVNLPLSGSKSIDLHLTWPSSSGGVLPELIVKSLSTADGQVFPNLSKIPLSALGQHEILKVELAPSPKLNPGASAGPVPPKLKIIRVAHPDKLSFSEVKQLWAPKEPRLTRLESKPDQGSVQLAWTSDGESDVSFRVWRNGALVSPQLNQTTWTDITPPTDQALCYSLEAEYSGSGHRSHRSQAQCLWQPGAITDFYSGDLLRGVNEFPALSYEGSRAYFGDWGWSGQQLAVQTFTPSRSGIYLAQSSYAHPGPISTGVTAGVKKLEIFSSASLPPVTSTILVMPHRGQGGFATSALSPIRLQAGLTYRLVLSDFWNMSYLEHFTSYYGSGGQAGSRNRIDLAGLKLLYFQP